jgi:hypothetical protein
MCRIRTGRFFPAILVALSITCGPASQALAAGIEPAFVGPPTAIPTEGLGASGPLRPSASL